MNNRQKKQGLNLLFGFLRNLLFSTQSGPENTSRTVRRTESKDKKRAESAAVRKTDLQELARRYENELMPYCFEYTFREKTRKPVQAFLEFDAGNFCHLFSIGSIVKETGEDPQQYAGMKGWNNIINRRITAESLERLDPEQYAYYAPEHALFDELCETLRHPSAVRYQAEKVSGSKLKADVLLYSVTGSQTIHIALSEDEDGRWFPRSYFVRDTDRDREYPTRYISGMPALDVSVRVSSKNA